MPQKQDWSWSFPRLITLWRLRLIYNNNQYYNEIIDLISDTEIIDLISDTEIIDLISDNET